MLAAILLQALAGVSIAKVGACIGAGIAAIGAGVGIGKIGASAMEATNNIRTNMIMTAAFIEGVALFAVVVCILALFL